MGSRDSAEQKFAFYLFLYILLFDRIRRKLSFSLTLQSFPTCCPFKTGGPMDHGGPIPIGDFGMSPDAGYLNQSPGAGMNAANNAEHIIGNGPRGNSPSEFMSNGNFSEPQNMQNEGLVW